MKNQSLAVPKYVCFDKAIKIKKFYTAIDKQKFVVSPASFPWPSEQAKKRLMRLLE